MRLWFYALGRLKIRCFCICWLPTALKSKNKQKQWTSSSIRQHSVNFARRIKWAQNGLKTIRFGSIWATFWPQADGACKRTIVDGFGCVKPPLALSCAPCKGQKYVVEGRFPRKFTGFWGWGLAPGPKWSKKVMFWMLNLHVLPFQGTNKLPYLLSRASKCMFCS